MSTRRYDSEGNEYRCMVIESAPVRTASAVHARVAAPPRPLTRRDALDEIARRQVRLFRTQGLTLRAAMTRVLTDDPTLAAAAGYERT
jgi:hypothetical protein